MASREALAGLFRWLDRSRSDYAQSYSHHLLHSERLVQGSEKDPEWFLAHAIDPIHGNFRY